MENKKRKSGKGLFRIFFMTVFCSVLLGGCSDPKRAEEIKNKALNYYKNKYKLEDVTITGSNAAGNNGLFGYLDVKDRAFEMSDGHSVYWNDAAETFADNGQAELIQEDFEKNILEPLLSEIPYPKAMEPCFLNRTGFESYDESVYTEYYDGDIRNYLKAVKPQTRGWTLALETEDRENGERQIQYLFETLKEYITGWGDVYILDEGLEEYSGTNQYSGTELYIDDHSRNVTVRANLNFEEDISWYRQAYIEIYDGIYVTSTKRDFTFEEGDILLEKAGTCADLQQMLDDSYYAMPVDAEENKNGGYMKRDQRHEDRVVLDHPEAPLFRLKMSQRVLDVLDSRNCIGAYIMDYRKNGLPLVMYYGKDSTAAISVYSVIKEPTGDIAEFDELSPDYLYFFGTYQQQPYEENK